MLCSAEVARATDAAQAVSSSCKAMLQQHKIQELTVWSVIKKHSTPHFWLARELQKFPEVFTGSSVLSAASPVSARF